MKPLYFNPETKVIFASDDAQDAAIQAITADEVPDLIANGATVDESAAGVGNEHSSQEQSSESSNAVSDPAIDAAPLAAGGTTVDVTQVDGHAVNSNVQNGNQLAGSDGNQLVNETPVVDAPALDGDTVTLTNVENDLNPLVPAAGTEGPPASQLAAQRAEEAAEPMPRDSHLLLLSAKLSAMRVKLLNQERIAIDELDQIITHLEAVL